MIQKPLLENLIRGLELLGEDPASYPCEAYLNYIELLGKWNRSYNLTAIRDKEKMVTHHILDSLTVLRYLHGRRCLDAGTGAGLPGFILALARPDQHWTLLDSNKKKIRFLNQAVLELKPVNVEISNKRLEDFKPDEKYSTIISRALMPLKKFYQYASPLLAEGGKILAMKGAEPAGEIKELETSGIHFDVHSLAIPKDNSERHVIVITI